ncbi:MAG: type II toxin-antitoxin system VapC family toxin [Candidatus Methanoperedens sp.]|nr:type II toxin-antitoxin system VapC family toxin [Candidatus Methanoperedens sp.]MCZ7360060.1 type II toxin-antitoxin system VapC family toxin [Candidatus Methanoperedens sp.]HLB70545.1 type II toxin-antitoxin system VapC family toxin [Candidatus Methanoperedens sp.]
MTLLDTDFLVSILRGKVTSKDAVDIIENPGTTIINAYELYYGARRSKDPEKSFFEVDSLLKSIDILELDRSAAIKAGNIQADLMNSGKPVNILDVLIAAIAITNNEIICTKNIEHFKRIKGLKWKEW